MTPVSNTVPAKAPNLAPFNSDFYSMLEKNIVAGNRMTVKAIAIQYKMTPVACRTALVNHYTMPNSKFIIGFTKGRTGGITLTAA